MIQPSIVLTIMLNINSVNVVVRDEFNFIVEMYYLPLFFNQTKIEEHRFKQQLALKINQMINEYDVNMILIERSSLFTNNISMFPDVSILKNVLLQYSIQTTLEDLYIDRIIYFMEIPPDEWKKIILNRKSIFSIDVYKSHILEKAVYEENLLQEIDSKNFYKTLCFSESVLYDRLMNKKYQINYEKRET